MSKGRLGTCQRLEGLLRLLHLHGEKQEFAVEQLQQSDLHLVDPRLLAGCGKLVWTSFRDVLTQASPALLGSCSREVDDL